MENSEFLNKAIPAIKAGKSATEIAKLVKMEDGKEVSARLTKLRKLVGPHGVEIPHVRKGRRSDPKEAENLAKQVRDLLAKSE